MDFYRWNPSEYREATYHLDPYQDGCYRRLIDEYMTTRKPLPNNDAALARICGISLEDWELHAKSILLAFFKPSNDVLHNKHCDEELDFQDNRSRFMKERAQKAAKARHNKNKDLHATSMLNDCLNVLDKRQEIRDISSKEDNPSISPHAEKYADEHQEAVRLYNELSERMGIPKVQKLSETRKKHLRARLKDCGGLDGWKSALEKLESIPAMRGDNGRGWKADFDFLMSESKFIKLMEGKYDGWKKQKTGSDLTKQQLQEWVDGR